MLECRIKLPSYFDGTGDGSGGDRSVPRHDVLKLLVADSGNHKGWVEVRDEQGPLWRRKLRQKTAGVNKWWRRNIHERR